MLESESAQIPQLNETGRIGETLSQQIPGRPEISPAKQMELDQDYVESGESYLAVDFDALSANLKNLEEKVSETEVPEKEVRMMVNGLTRNQINIIHDHMMDRISKETDIFKTNEEITQFFKDLEAAGVLNEKFGIDFQPRHNFQADNASTDPFRNKITVYGGWNGEQTTYHADIISLVNDGTFPRESGMVQHEQIHNIQVSQERMDMRERFPYIPATLLKFWTDLRRSVHIKGNSSKDEIYEAHAFRGSDLYTYTDKDDTELINNMANSGNYMVETDKLIAAFHRTEQLLALGFSHKEIARLMIHNGDYSEDEADFPGLKTAVLKKGTNLNLQEDDIENLVLAKRLETEIQKLKATLIAREELKKVLDKREAISKSHRKKEVN